MRKKIGSLRFFNYRSIKLYLCSALVLTILLFLSCSSVSADKATVEKYAPILYFEGLEQLYPIDAIYHIDHSDLFSFDGETSTLLDTNPTSENLSNILNEFFYLDNVQADLRDASSIINQYNQEKNNYDPIVYYRETIDSGKSIIQYWFFYAYNQGDLNVHEGDWEMIQLILESDKPTQVMYSQHHSGQQTTWEHVETTGTHPHVYVARGSHANYLRSFSGKLGVASDTVGNNGLVMNIDDYLLVELSDQGWLSFAGRWGEVESIQDTIVGFSGPPGPMYRENGEMWNNPMGWGGNLPALNTALLPIEFLLYHFITIFVILTVISIGILSFRLYRRKQKHGLGPRIFSFLYVDGINRHSMGNILFFIAIIIAIIGLTLPWYSVSGSVDSEGYTTEGIVDFLAIDGLNGVHISYPGSNGPVALSSLILPFSLLIGIGFLFTIFKSVGIKESRYLGRIYLFRGIGLITPFIILLIVIFTIGNIISSIAPPGSAMNEINTFLTSLSQNPLAGSEIITISEGGVIGTITLIWGLELGGYLLLFAGIILIAAAVLLKRARKEFY